MITLIRYGTNYNSALEAKECHQIILPVIMQIVFLNGLIWHRENTRVHYISE